MKKLFIYYSLTGNGDVVAEYMRKQRYKIEKIKTKSELPKNTVLRILTGGFKALINYKDKIDKLNIKLDDYDEIIVGSPIWNSRVSSPINTLLDSIEKDKKVIFIFWSGSGKSTAATKKLRIKYPSSKIIDLKEPKSNNNELKKIQAGRS